MIFFVFFLIFKIECQFGARCAKLEFAWELSDFCLFLYFHLFIERQLELAQ